MFAKMEISGKHLNCSFGMNEISLDGVKHKISGAYLAPYLHAQAKDWMEKYVEDCGLSSFPYDWALNDSSDKNR